MEDLSPLNKIGRNLWNKGLHGIRDTIRARWFPVAYLCLSALLLVAGTVYWALLGAHVQVHNADQLSDPYLFSNWQTFHQAYFPSAHTFLIKWPIFALLGLAGINSAGLAVATVAVALSTVAVLMFVLYKILRRPLVLGTLYMALGFVLLLVPAQPYAGGLLPVNMAMLTTRNLEYAMYLVALILIIRSARLRSWMFVCGTALLGLLIASDKLFAGLSVGGALIVLVVYALVTNWRMVTLATCWLMAGVLATLGGGLLLAALGWMHLTHFVGGSGVSPYTAGSGIKSVVLGVTYGVTGFFTNLGANPAYDNRIVGHLPADMLRSLSHLAGVLHSLAAVAVALALLGAVRFLYGTLRRAVDGDHVHTPLAEQLSVALVASTIAAAGMFVATQHYYAVDARYLSIGFFALAICTATLLRRRYWNHPRRWFAAAGTLLLAASIGGAFVAWHTTQNQSAAYNNLANRNSLVVQALEHHKVDLIVGDYWRTLPIKLASHGSLTALPLGGCTTPAVSLTSGAWQKDLQRHSFAYLITLSGSLTNYPNCTLPQVTTVYGRPNSIQVIAGTVDRPAEALLFYDQGSHPSPRPTAAQIPTAPLLPVATGELAKTDCSQATIMNIVAHEDDDLLFLSPDLLDELHAGNCVRTVYMTAGDSGYSKFYWLSRQLGVEAAYSTMLGTKNVWDQQTVSLAPGEFATVATLRDSAQVSLVFLDLPDGNLHGDGFPDSQHQSLQKLYHGTLTSLQAVDGQSSYTSAELISALATLMNVYQPAEVHTQADVPSDQYPDHSDHMVTGWFAELAAQQYDRQHFGGAIAVPVRRYVGYPIHGYTPNITDGQLAEKEAAFLAYAHYDGGVCQSITQCAGMATYGSYLHRQYQANTSQ